MDDFIAVWVDEGWDMDDSFVHITGCDAAHMAGDGEPCVCFPCAVIELADSARVIRDRWSTTRDGTQDRHPNIYDEPGRRGVENLGKAR